MQRPAVLFSRLFIGNEFVDSCAGKTFPVIDPSTEAVICQVQEADAEDVDIAVQSARKAFALNSPWRTMNASQRGRLLYRLSDEIEQNIDYLTQLEAMDAGKPLDSARGDIEFAVRTFRYFAGFADKLHGKVIPADGDVICWTRREPVGVVGAIIPWNYPLDIIALKLAPALCCGCTVVIALVGRKAYNCYECESMVINSCKNHPIMWIKNVVVDDCDASSSGDIKSCTCSLDRTVHAKKTAPEEYVFVGRSSIRSAGLGVWAEKEIPLGTIFGPYGGEVVYLDALSPEDLEKRSRRGYAWLVRENLLGTKGHLVDATNPVSSNWLRFVNCARNDEEQTLVTIQYRGKIYYRACKMIPPNVELLTFYGEKFARELGIATADEMLIPIDDATKDSLQHESGEKCADTPTSSATAESDSSMGQSSATSGSHSVDHIANSVTEFLYDSQVHTAFDSWYKRYEDLFSVDLAAQDDAWKVRLLLRKLGPAEHERYANFILPKNPREVTFQDTVQTLPQIFGEQSSFFNIRFQCLQLCKRESDDFITYAGIVNRECGRPVKRDRFQ
ncbi:hypothetical protein SprV_0100003800 [Sparganum proliferum]